MTTQLQDGSLFFHVPKTGSTWVEETLRELNLVKANVGRQHAAIANTFAPESVKAREIAKFYGRWLIGRRPDPRGFLFCFVRHPLRWYESYFKHMTSDRRRWSVPGVDETLLIRQWKSDDFDQFIRNVIATRPGYLTQMYSRFTDHETMFVGKQENLRTDLVTALRHTTLEFDEDYILERGRANVSQAPRSDVMWDEGLKQEILRLEYAAIVRYGYQNTDV
jgi:hypothetical protein